MRLVYTTFLISRGTSTSLTEVKCHCSFVAGVSELFRLFRCFATSPVRVYPQPTAVDHDLTLQGSNDSTRPAHSRTWRVELGGGGGGRAANDVVCGRRKCLQGLRAPARRDSMARFYCRPAATVLLTAVHAAAAAARPTDRLTKYSSPVWIARAS